MRLSILTAVLIFLAAPSYGQSPAPDAPNPEIIVRLSSDAPSSLRQQLEGTRPKSASPLFDGVTSTTSVFPNRIQSKSGTGFQAYTISVRDSTALQVLKTRWQETEGVAYVQDNGFFSLQSADEDPLPRRPPESLSHPFRSTPVPPTNLLADSLDHLDVVRAREGWEVTRGDETVRIGILDSGIYLDHPDLQSSLAVNDAEDLNGNGRLDEGDLNGVDDDGNGFVDDVVGYDFVDRPGFFLDGEYETRDPDPSPDLSGSFSRHGTLVAGVAAARAADTTAGIYGVAPDARFVPLRAFAGDGRGQTDDIAAAIVYAADAGLDVLNLSFGRSRPAPLLEEAVQYALDRGTVVVASAGNELTDEPHYPSDYPGVISVVWLAEDGEGLPDFNRSQFGIGVDIGAPGTNVYTTRFPASKLRNEETPELDDLYGNANGSSFAAPQVAGAAALLRSVRADVSPASVRSILTRQAADLEEENWDHTTGAGRLDVAASLVSVLPGNTELTSPAHNAGFTGTEPIPVVGTAMDPAFASYSIFYAEGTTNLDEGDPWIPIAGPVERQIRADTLATWDASDLPNGEYTLRLVTTLQGGRTIEDRRRVVIDDTAPALTVRFLGPGLVGGRYGVVSDLETDDRTRTTMRVRIAGETVTTESEFVAKRQGLNAVPEIRSGGTAEVRVEAVNRAGLSTTFDTTFAVPPSALNTAYFERMETSVPRGRLLPQTTDFDTDQSAEIVLNQLDGRGISDTLRSFEWAPGGFVPADTLIANVIPKDVGDPEGNGRTNLLTQITAVTLLLEQGGAEAFPKDQAFVDTTGLNDPGAEDALIGTLLTDLDDDGNGEIVGNNQREWRVLEWDGSSYTERYRLSNPTSPATIDSAQNANRFGTAEAVDGDFDDDGRRDLLVGDRDGDWTVYESCGDDRASPAWTFETRRFDAGNRFGTGDWDGDGVEEFVTFSTYYPLPIEPGEFEPFISYYHVWDAAGDDAYERVFRLPVAGESSGQGSIATADFDGDGRDEIAFAFPPSLYLLDFAPQDGWQVVFHDATDPPIFSRSMVADDVDGDGTPELLTATEGDSLAMYRVQQQALASAPPEWTAARPTGADGVRLRWTAAGADSVTVYEGDPGSELDPVETLTDSTTTLSRTSLRAFALRAWRGGEASPFSEMRRVRPHPPATVAAVDYPSDGSVRLQFTEPMSPSTRGEQFTLSSASLPDALSPDQVLPGSGGTTLALRFDPDALPERGTLSWTGVRDTSGLAAGQTSTAVEFPAPSDARLIVESAEILGEQSLRLRFSEPLQPAAARDLDHYRVRPSGRVSQVEFSEEDPQEVTLQIEGIVIGATGQNSSLEVTSMTSSDGRTLAANTGAVKLNRPADDLDNVFVYPNPYRAQQHGRLTIGGLPLKATIRIFSPAGQLVRVLDAAGNRGGGRTWDLRNERGDTVPSGVYLIRVESPNSEPVLKKAAVIR